MNVPWLPLPTALSANGLSQHQAHPGHLLHLQSLPPHQHLMIPGKFGMHHFHSLLEEFMTVLEVGVMIVLEGVVRFCNTYARKLEGYFIITLSVCPPVLVSMCPACIL